jgi:uncharacterized protein (DUF305 family)
VSHPSTKPDVEERDDELPQRRGRHVWGRLGLGVVAVLVIVAVGLLIMGPRTPSDTSAEAGFARDMQAHHAQAVEMAFLLRDKTDDATMRTIAFDIITTQQQQMGQMYGWLRMWGLAQSTSQPAMAWMGTTGGHGTMVMDGTPPTGGMTQADMPGMATREQLDALRKADGPEAEVLFLRLMIEHHRGGIAMAQAARELASDDNVILLADAIASSQAAEIEQMEQLLQDRGARLG